MRSCAQISVALGVAIKETGRTNPTAVTVFTDSKAGVKIQNEHLVDQREKELRDFRIVELSTWHQHQTQERGGLYLSKPKKWHRRNARKDVKKLCSPLLPT